MPLSTSRFSLAGRRHILRRLSYRHAMGSVSADDRYARYDGRNESHLWNKRAILCCPKTQPDKSYRTPLVCMYQNALRRISSYFVSFRLTAPEMLDLLSRLVDVERSDDDQSGHRREISHCGRASHITHGTRRGSC